MKKQKKIILIALAVLLTVGTFTAIYVQKPNLPSENSSVSGDNSEHDEDCDDEIVEPTTSPTIEPTLESTPEPSDEPVEDEETQTPTTTPSATTKPTETTTPSATSTPTPTVTPSITVTPDDTETDVVLPQSAEEEALMIFESRVAKGCSVCGSKTCSTFNYSDLTVDSSRCEQYSDATNPALYCQICGKVNGNGTNGTCCTPMWDTVCYYCGEDIIAGQCHTCN
ncbi:MAG: hypothetical protein R3Y35_11185 [Clostridia bacterium]